MPGRAFPSQAFAHRIVARLIAAPMRLQAKA
jgi:hypothetical protein